LLFQEKKKVKEREAKMRMKNGIKEVMHGLGRRKMEKGEEKRSCWAAGERNEEEKK
jgi:hypothetical protein